MASLTLDSISNQKDTAKEEDSSVVDTNDFQIQSELPKSETLRQSKSTQSSRVNERGKDTITTKSSNKEKTSGPDRSEALLTEREPQKASVGLTDDKIAGSVSVIESKKQVAREIDETMVMVRGGDFILGCMFDTPEKCAYTGMFKRKVVLSTFAMSKYEITQRQFEQVMGYNPSAPGHKGCGSCPVDSVSWTEATAFIKKLNDLSDQFVYRLPTEAEWEYAAKGGRNKDKYLYSGSDTLEVVAWCKTNSQNRTHPVGTKKPNSLGIYDMTGNVAEWIYDWRQGNNYNLKEYKNPIGFSKGQGKSVRGLSYTNNYRGVSTITIRSQPYPLNRKRSGLGFRVVSGRRKAE